MNYILRNDYGKTRVINIEKIAKRSCKYKYKIFRYLFLYNYFFFFAPLLDLFVFVIIQILSYNVLLKGFYMSFNNIVINK